jgi:D-alanine--poly(phosphoribitol) ligase subunit 1
MIIQDVVSLFLDRAAARPDHLAIGGRGRTLTYAALEQRVRHFAAVFARVANPRVLIGLPQGADAYAAMFAAGLAGGYYAPLNTAAPVEKLCRIAGLLQPDIILATPALRASLAGAAPKATVLDPAALPDVPLFAGHGSRHPMGYVMFTSGSTGLPKGVMVSRTALNHYVSWAIDADIVRPEDLVSQHPNIAFDVSVTDIYGALCQGATLFPIAGASDRLMPSRMIQREGITVWNSVPSVVNLMMQAGEVTTAMLRSVRLFNFLGEPLLREQLRAIFAARPDVAVNNTYGPTEATVSMTHLRLTASDYEAVCTTSVALGEAIADMGLHLVGGSHPDEGELVITGPQLADGYWNDPERSAAVFRPLETGATVWFFSRNGSTSR